MSKGLYFYKVRIDRVVDGDTLFCTFDLGLAIYTKEYVRLYDVDTAEVRGVNYEDRGHWATLYVELWLRGMENEFPDYYLDDDTKAYEQLKEFYQKNGHVPYLDTIYIDSRRYDPRDVYGRVLGAVYRGHELEPLNEALLREGLEK